MHQTENRPKRYLTFSQVAERYGNVHPSTVKRWVEQGKLPPPDRMPNGREGFTEDRLEQHERALVGGTV